MDCLSREVWICGSFGGSEQGGSSCGDLSSCMCFRVGDPVSTSAFRFRGVTSMGLLPVLDVKRSGTFALRNC